MAMTIWDVLIALSGIEDYTVDGDGVVHVRMPEQ